MRPRIIICETCAGDDGLCHGSEIAKALRGRVEVAIETVACLNVCDEPIAVALRDETKDAYVFAGVLPSDTDDLAALCDLYTKAEPTIEDARPAGRLRFCLKGRIPV